ncbi:aminopeptidase P family protein [Rhodovibrionaceae bacterium A322]
MSDTASHPSSVQTTSQARRVSALRQEMEKQDLDGFLVPRSDEYQGEYVPPSAERLAWISGFTGSAGQACILKEQAALFVDGRYTIQARDEVEVPLFELRHISDQPLSAFLDANLKGHEGRKARLGYDPRVHTQGQIRALKKSCAAAGGQAVACQDNPLDLAWTDRPAAPQSPVAVQELQYSGQSSQDKRQALAQELRQAGLDAAVIALPESICWILNVRGGDVPCTPFVLSAALLHADGRLDWFVDPVKLSPEVRSHLGNEIALYEPEQLGPQLDQLAGKKIAIDPASASAWHFDRLEGAGAHLVEREDLCQLPKAAKNSVELDGMRRSHLRDGAKLSRFLAWMDREAPKGHLDEMSAAAKLLELRQEDALYRDLSFDTISATGPNAAICHYRVNETSNRPIDPQDVYLVDSGGQYLDGTTDVTRTIAVGQPSEEVRRRFTLVLKGHIALARVRFPEGTSGSQLDALARQFLWQEGLDFDHGTGHGVGAYLSVHEGPQRISKMPNKVALLPGMVVSNEPGYYKTDAYGMRMENLQAVVKLDKQPGQDQAMLGFEVLTFAPIDRKLIDEDLLSGEERDWLNDYHQKVLSLHKDKVDPETAAWLDEVCAPL